MRVWTCIFVVFCQGVSLVAAEDPYARAELLASQRQFDQAEEEYLRQLGGRPADWRLRLGLARVILWDGRYAEAERHFTQLLAERPADGDALLGHAQAAYWRGDFRQAERRFGRLLEVDPTHAEAKQALAELKAVSAPRYEVRGAHRDDSQPYTVSTMRATVSYFSDPLTRWDVFGSAGDVSGGADPLAAIGAGGSVSFPRIRTAFEARLERFRFPDGESEFTGDVRVTHSLPWRSALVLSAERAPLLGTTSSVQAHATSTQYTITWRRDPAERWLAAINGHVIDYSDDNRGRGADGWLLAPVFSRRELLVRAGLSAAWRDTELDRFRFTNFRSEAEPSGLWRYTYSGVYDPYWTPQDLKEGRLVVAAEYRRLKIHADGGFARDRAVGFGPSRGSTPTPLFVFPHVQTRSFRPWRAGAEFWWPLTTRVEFRARYRHDVTAFYRANEFEASLGGRL